MNTQELDISIERSAFSYIIIIDCYYYYLLIILFIGNRRRWKEQHIDMIRSELRQKFIEAISTSIRNIPNNNVWAQMCLR